MTDPLTTLTIPDQHTVRAWVVKITAVDVNSGTCTIDPNDGDLVTEVPYWGSAPAVGSVQVALLFDGLLGVMVSGAVPVSGVWPVGELDPWAAAATFPSYGGQPIYLDSRGQLRSQPMVLWRDNPLVGDSPAVYPMGMSILTLSTAQATAGGWPLSTSAIVTTFRRYNDTVCVQYWQRNSTVTPGLWYRQGNDANTPKWSPWTKIVDTDVGWVDVTILPGFAATNTAEKPMVRLKDGIVYLRGIFLNTGITATNTSYIVGQLPAGYYPTMNLIGAMGVNPLSTTAHFLIAGSNGQVQVRTGPALSGYYAFGGQSWPID